MDVVSLSPTLSLFLSPQVCRYVCAYGEQGDHKATQILDTGNAIAGRPTCVRSELCDNSIVYFM